MWPSTRRLWPPLVCLCNLWGSWEDGFPARERGCEGLQRGMSQGANQRDGQGLGPLAERQGRQQEVGGCRRRPYLAWESAAGHRHHTYVTIGPRRFSQAGCRPHGRNCSRGSQKAERAHLRKRAGFTGKVACWSREKREKGKKTEKRGKRVKTGETGRKVKGRKEEWRKGEEEWRDVLEPSVVVGSQRKSFVSSQSMPLARPTGAKADWKIPAIFRKHMTRACFIHHVQ